MPRYFFDLEIDGDRMSPDTEGVDLPDTDLALAYASGLLSTFQPDQDGLGSGRVVVKNEAGVVVRSLPQPSET